MFSQKNEAHKQQMDGFGRTTNPLAFDGKIAFSKHKESFITLFGAKILKFAREVPRENKSSSSFEIWRFLLLSFWSWNLI